MNPIGRIASVTDATVGRLVQPGSFAALGDEIVSTSLATPQVDAGRASGRYGRGPRARRLSGSWRRRLLIGVPLAAGLAVAGVIATSLGSPGQRVGPISVGPPAAQALSFTRHGHYIDVIVRNPLADPKRYRAEFAKYHLDITLRLVPASPSIVGTLVYGGGDGIVPITAVGKCFIGGGGNACPVGVKVPVDFRGAATIVFGRAARPGEQYESAGQAGSPGEVMHGLHYEGKTVAAVLAMLARRGASVSTWRVQRAGDCYTEVRRTVPASWLVYDAVPWAPGQVLLWAAKTLPVPTCAPVPGTPVPSASPRSSP
jgi:hypothetical protein